MSANGPRYPLPRPLPRDEETTPTSNAQASELGTQEQVLRSLAQEHSDTAGKVDTLIDDGRRHTAVQRSHRVKLSIIGRLLHALDKRVAGLEGAVVVLTAQTTDTQAAIGTAPNPAALMRASSTDLSPDAVAKLELGTGLRRQVAELHVNDMQALLRAASAAGKSAGTRGAVIGGSASAVVVAAITHADKIAALVRVVFGG